jgi:Mrp family chromosome partitioning ATPase
MSVWSRKSRSASPASLSVPSLVTGDGRTENAEPTEGTEALAKGSKRRSSTSRTAQEQLEVWIGEVLVLRAPPTVTRSLRYLMAAGGLPPTFGVTSSIHGEGVTSISRTLAALIASDWRQSTCWVDLNWWKLKSPAHEATLFDHTMSDVVEGHALPADVPRETSIPGLAFLSAGEVPTSSRAQFSTSLPLLDALGELAKKFEYLVLDLPPVLTTSDAVTLSGLTNGFLLVVRQEAASSVQVKAALGAMTSAPCLGAVLNGAQTNVPRSLRTSSEVWALGT